MCPSLQWFTCPFAACYTELDDNKTRRRCPGTWVWALFGSVLHLQDNISSLTDTGGTGAPAAVPWVTASLDILQQLAQTKRALTYKKQHMPKKPLQDYAKNINAHGPEEFHWTNWTYSHEWISANFSMSVKEMARSICAIGKGSVACSTVDSTSWRARKGSGCREDRDDSPGCF